MPTYRYQCGCADTWEVWQPMAASPLTECPTCGQSALRVLGPVRTHGVGARGLTSRRVDATERQWDRDRPAYKRLRNAGYQPPNVDGADRLEATAVNDLEINTGLRYGPIPERSTKDAMALAQESGWVPRAP